jgi:undecaprenyl phosphate N,N'-diacetylbacillosamine 1-phosphate transferase
MYDEVQRRRYKGRPRITGLAQVEGRNQMKFSERLRNDVYYVEYLSFVFDIKILLMTVKSVLFKSSTVSEGQTIEDAGDIGLSKKLSSYHLRKTE